MIPKRYRYRVLIQSDWEAIELFTKSFTQLSSAIAYYNLMLYHYGKYGKVTLQEKYESRTCSGFYYFRDIHKETPLL